MDIRTLVERISCRASRLVGNSYAFVYAVIAIVVWILVGPIYHYSDGWQLFMTVTTNIISFLMLFLIENSQNRDTALTQEDFEEIKSLLKQNKLENKTLATQLEMKGLLKDLDEEQTTEENLMFARNVRYNREAGGGFKYSVLWESTGFKDKTEVLYSSDPLRLHLKHLTRYHKTLTQNRQNENA